MLYDFLRRSLILILLFIINSGFSNERQISNGCKKIYAINTPARICVRDRWDFHLSGSFIYWAANEDGISIASIRDHSNVPSVIKTYSINSSYKPGFKVAFGMNCKNYDNWVLEGEYTYFHMKQHRSASITLETENVDVDPAFLSIDATLNADGFSLDFTDCAGTWKNTIDLIDINLGRPFYSGKKFILSPYIGLRGGWLDQSLHGNYLAFDVDNDDQLYTITSKSTQNSWIIGPRIGIGFDWFLGCTKFRLIMDSFGSIFYQHFKDSFSDFFSTIGFVNTPVSTFKQSKNTVNSNIDLLLSLGYGTYFAKNKYYFDLKAGYNFQIFFCQNRLSRLPIDESNTFSNVYLDGYTPSNLILHGINVTMRFDF